MHRKYHAFCVCTCKGHKCILKIFLRKCTPKWRVHAAIWNNRNDFDTKHVNRVQHKDWIKFVKSKAKLQQRNVPFGYLQSEYLFNLQLHIFFHQQKNKMPKKQCISIEQCRNISKRLKFNIFQMYLHFSPQSALTANKTKILFLYVPFIRWASEYSCISFVSFCVCCLALKGREWSKMAHAAKFDIFKQIASLPFYICFVCFVC